MEKLLIGGKEIDMTRSIFSTALWTKFHEVGTNIVFGDNSRNTVSRISWLLTPESSSPNPGLSKNMVIGGVYAFGNRGLMKPLITTILHLQYGLGIKGYSSSTCALEWDGEDNNSSFVFVNKCGIIHERNPHGKYSREGFSAETYGATVGQPCDYEIWFEHTKPEGDVYSVWQKETIIGLLMLRDVFDRIGSNYVEDDHRFVATAIESLISMGIPVQSIETMLTKVSGYLEGCESRDLSKLIEFVDSLNF